jgi:hypothetical protein
MRDHSFGNFKMVSKFLKNFSHLSKYKRIVVLLCAGRVETELLSEDLCICMDVDKQGLFPSLIALRYVYRKKANIIHHRRDMSVGIYSLLETIWKISELPVVVLFQHSCPTTSKDRLSRSASDCFCALSDYFIDSFHFVYGSHINLNKNCWNYQSLKNVLSEDCSLSVLSCIYFTSEDTISEMDSVDVQHPIFGLVPHAGWAGMKKRDEGSIHCT